MVKKAIVAQMLPKFEAYPEQRMGDRRARPGAGRAPTLPVTREGTNTVPLILPEGLEPVGRHLGVPNRVRDVLVPEVVLQRPRVVPVVGELEPAGMAKHVRVSREGQLGHLAGPCDQLSDVTRRHRPASLGHEQVRTVRPVPTGLAQRAQFRAAQWMRRGDTVLQPVDVQ